MGIKTGLDAVGTYATVTTTTTTRAEMLTLVNTLVDIIPDPDTAPAQGGGNSLDSMAPITAAQLLVELDALKAAIAAA